MAASFLNQGRVDEAIQIFERGLEHNFHSVSEMFVPELVRRGEVSLALVVADLKFQLDSAPVIEWIRAVENPAGDNSAGFARLRDWERRTQTDLGLRDIAVVYFAFNGHEEFAQSTYPMFYIWNPEGRKFRQTPYFKDVVRQHGALLYWQENGFPDFCRSVGNDDFECDDPY
jgi:hypothetical protein